MAASARKKPKKLLSKSAAKRLSKKTRRSALSRSSRFKSAKIQARDSKKNLKTGRSKPAKKDGALKTHSRRRPNKGERLKAAKPTSQRKGRKSGARQFSIPLTDNLQLVIALRRRSRPGKRSRKLVIPLFTRRLVIPLRRQALLTLSLLLLGLGGSIYFGWQYFGLKAASIAPPPAPAIEAPPTVQAPIQPVGMTRSEPSQLSIASLNIKTSLITLGRNGDGTMEVPSRYDVAGWYKHGPTPGELGPAVIVGHVTSPKAAAIFYRLGEMKPGEIIEVVRADGQTVRFKVDAVKQFPQDAFPSEEVYGNLDHPGLRLITCGGVYNRQVRSYTHNTVVFASQVS